MWISGTTIDSGQRAPWERGSHVEPGTAETDVPRGLALCSWTPPCQLILDLIELHGNRRPLLRHMAISTDRPGAILIKENTCQAKSIFKMILTSLRSSRKLRGSGITKR